MEQLLRQRAESIWTAAIRSVLPDEAVRRALEHFHPQGRVFLVAAGKRQRRGSCSDGMTKSRPLKNAILCLLL